MQAISNGPAKPTQARVSEIREDFSLLGGAETDSPREFWRLFAMGEATAMPCTLADLKRKAP
jgi:hypothetical protein